MIKKVLVACGSGVVTSTIVIGKLTNELERLHLQHKVQLFQGTLSDIYLQINDYDLIVVTTLIDDAPEGAPIISAIPLLSGVNPEQFMKQFFELLNLPR